MVDDKTTVTLNESERERLTEYEHDGHHRVGEAISMLMDIVPTPERLREDGCQVCDRPPAGSANDPLNKQHGIIKYDLIEDPHGTGEWFTTLWFCSMECANEFEEQRKRAIPRNPDKVIVGGYGEFQTTIEDASFTMDGHAKQVGLDVPGAFTGEANHHGEYDYMGEPVYVFKAGEVRQSGVIEEIYHEESSTTLDLGTDIAVEKLNHPDAMEAAEFATDHRVGKHTVCGDRVIIPRESDADPTCPHCMEKMDMDEFEEFDIEPEKSVSPGDLADEPKMGQ